MKWYYYLILIIVFALIGFFSGWFYGTHKKVEQKALIISSQPSKEQQILSDSIVKLKYKLSHADKSLVKVLRFKPTIGKNDTVKIIVESLKIDTAKIVYLQNSLIKSLNAYVICEKLNTVQDSMLKILVKNIGIKDSINADLAAKNIKLKEGLKIFRFISGGCAAGIGVLLLIL